VARVVRPSFLDQDAQKKSGERLLNFLKRTKTAGEVLKTMFEVQAEAKATLRTQADSWNDEEVAVATYLQEEDCLSLFVIFSAIQRCKLSSVEKGFLLDLFREVLSGDVRAGKVDPQIEMNLQNYCEAVNAPYPEHLNPLWNIGLAFARHVGADKDIAYVQRGATGYGRPLILAVQFLNTMGKSYRVIKG
jgi:predicted proteasome-type protease